ncbi:MAG: hypothetical protein LBJ02_03865 [Bifidobacteriaceae bacterium]|jgi:hypothetical protein|nr:hypothetical protein [Bifidobacteriaceae bacterium]
MEIFWDQLIFWLNLLLYLALPAGVCVFLVWRARRYPTTSDIAWAACAPNTSTAEALDPQARELYRAYLRRHNRFQVVGASAGMAFALIAQLRAFGQIDFGAGGPPIVVDPIFACLLGAVTGGMMAQAYRLRPPGRSPVRSARLEPRPQRPALAARRWSWALVALSLAGATCRTALTGNWNAVLWAAAGSGALVLAELAQDAIWSRRRLLLNPSVMAADTRLRTLSASSLAWTQLAMAILTTAWSLGVLPMRSWGLPISRFGLNYPASDWAWLLAAAVVALFTLGAVHRGSLHAPKAWRRTRLAVRT